MPGALKAKVGGNWVLASSAAGGGGAEEVYVGPLDPGSNYDLWIDTGTAPTLPPDARWNTAWGTVATGSLIAATSIPVGVTKITSDIVFKSVPGRRYRFVLQVRIVGATTGNGVNFLPLGPGVGGATWDTWVTTAVWAPLYTEVLFNGNDTSGNFYWNANNAGTGAVQVYFDSMSCVYIEDIGPVTGALISPDPTPPWLPLPFASLWSSYGSGYQPGGYRKLGDVVYLRGLLNQASGAGGTMFTLPAGYRPLGGISLGWHLTSTGMVRYDINPSGTFNTSGTLTAGNWMSVEGVNFSVTP